MKNDSRSRSCYPCDLRVALAVFLYAALCVPAIAAEPAFRVVVEDRVVKMLGTTDVPRRCTTRVGLSFLKNGAREGVGFDCMDYELKVGKDELFCKATAPDLIDVKVETEIKATCVPLPAITKK